MHSPRLSPSRETGLTLVELMVALTLGIIIVAALLGVFVSNSSNFRQNEAMGALQDNARFALDAISRDLAMAGYWGGVRAADAGTIVRVSAAAIDDVAKASATGDCGPATQAASYYWLFDVSQPIEFRNQSVTTAMTQQFTCLDHVKANTDVLVIRRVSGAPIFTVDALGTRAPATAETTANRFYLKSNQTTASLYRAGSSFSLSGPTDCPDAAGVSAVCEPSSNPVQVYAYTPQIYYVRDYLSTVNDGIPILCRRYLNDTLATPTMEEDCLAEGVENLQIEWGINSGSDAVGSYDTNPDAARLALALTARIHILVRAISNDTQASGDTKTFQLADETAFTTPAGQRVLRRAFSTVVQLKNLQPT